MPYNLTQKQSIIPTMPSEMFAFHEAEDEKVKLARWKEEDPIQLQDTYNTSEAFLQACIKNDVEEVK